MHEHSRAARLVHPFLIDLVVAKPREPLLALSS
jgi:hypothetical protein